MVAIKFLLTVMLAAFCFAPSSSALARSQYCHIPPLVSRALKIDLRNPDMAHVWDLKMKLIYFEANVPHRCIAVIVPRLVDMLHSDNDVVRGYAADTLGEIGLPGQAAIPVLEQALRDDTCGTSPCAGRAGSANEIELAMLRIATPGKDPYLPLGPTADRRSCHEIVQRLRSLKRDYLAPHSAPAYDAGRTFARYAATIPDRCKQAVLPLLVRMLQDRDDLTRLYAAQAIGYLGAAAHSAVPALKQALNLDKCVCPISDCMKGAWTSARAIEDAIIMITGSEGDPAPYRCTYSGSVPAR
jgi:hypothetical protein